MSGYSGTQLAKKLGLKGDFIIRLVNQPDNYIELFTDWPNPLVMEEGEELDLIHYFETSKERLQSELPVLAKEIKKDGKIWVSWPKKSSGVATDITEQTIRDVCLPLGLVDVKVCAVDKIWSGLKLVWRKELR